MNTNRARSGSQTHVERTHHGRSAPKGEGSSRVAKAIERAGARKLQPGARSHACDVLDSTGASQNNDDCQ